MSTDIDTFFKELPKAADVKAEIANCHDVIKQNHAFVRDQRNRIKRLRRLLSLAEAEGGKIVKRGPRKKKAPADDTQPMFVDENGQAA